MSTLNSSWHIRKCLMLQLAQMILFWFHFGRADDRSPQPGKIQTVRALFSLSDNIPTGSGFLPGWTAFLGSAAGYAHPHFRRLLATEQERFLTLKSTLGDSHKSVCKQQKWHCCLRRRNRLVPVGLPVTLQVTHVTKCLYGGQTQDLTGGQSSEPSKVTGPISWSLATV